MKDELLNSMLFHNILRAQIFFMVLNLARTGLIPKVPFLFRRNISTRESCPVRVVTDIDDTVKSSGGVRLFGIALGGIDVSFNP